MPAKAGCGERKLPLGRLVGEGRLEAAATRSLRIHGTRNTPFPGAAAAQASGTWQLTSEGRVLLTIGRGACLSSSTASAGAGPRAHRQCRRPIFAPWGDFPLTTAFLPLVQQIARLSVGADGPRIEIRKWGTACRCRQRCCRRDQGALPQDARRAIPLPVQTGAPLLEARGGRPALRSPPPAREGAGARSLL